MDALRPRRMHGAGLSGGHARGPHHKIGSREQVVGRPRERAVRDPEFDTNQGIQRLPP
jgi:hypothetical protein